jgi:threonylcarbamoyladenosine tRNA methylthiotransferase MtaB
MEKARSIFFATLGCRLNQAETLSLKLEARKKGFYVTSNETEADILILNSCSVTDKAQKDTDKILGNFSVKYPKKKIIVTGCGAKDEHSIYGLVVKNKNKAKLFQVVSNSLPMFQYKTTPGVVSAGNIGTVYRKTRVMIKVQDGCNNFCAYCIVPYLRGREKSRDAEGIIEELKAAEKSGFKEVVLCGVNIGKYSSSVSSSGFLPDQKVVWAGTWRSKIPASAGMTDKTSIAKLKLADLIQEILKKTTLPRIRLSSINPDDFSDDLVDLWVGSSRLCNHFHISLQSGSDTVLKRMGRKYNTKQYSSRKEIPEVQITTDIIVGFPGETEAEYAETIDFVKRIGFLKVHVFRYSPREGTRAAKMPNQISEKEKKERAVKLQRLESEIRQSIIKNYIGKEVEVLFEQGRPVIPAEAGIYTYSGFTPNYIKVFKKSPKNITNEIVKVKIKEVAQDKLIAK